eukprot:Em0001g2780a
MVTNKNSSLPLKSVQVRADVKGYVTGLETALLYTNDSDDPAEVVFRFPVEQSHAVVGLTAVLDGRRVKAQLHEKEEARAIYDDAIASGQTAALGEEKSGDVFSVSLGNLPPRTDAEVHLKLVGDLPVDAEGGVRFALPASLKPRYAPAGFSDPAAPIQGGSTGQGADVKRANGPGVSGFTMTVHNAADVEAVTSPTHSISSSRDGEGVTVTLLEGNLEKDLVILIKHREPHKPAVLVEGGATSDITTKGYMSGPVVMVTFYPEFPAVEAAGEFFFLVDRSGSMSGSYINSARETLILFLKSLSEGCFFNIIGFGSSYVDLFPSSLPYNQDSLSKAVSHAQTVEADLGGTELLPPLEHVFSLKPRPGLPRQVFVLTDGSVSNTQQCVECVRKYAHMARCFTFGIGSGASTDLVEGLAKAGGGTSEFVKEGERMQAKVIRSLKRALQPAVTDVVVKFKVPTEFEVLQSPQTIPPIFNGEKLVMYGIMSPKTTPTSHASGVAMLKGLVLGASIEHTISFSIDSTPSEFPTIHHLAGKALIKDWEQGNRRKEDIVELSKEMGVVSSHTAYIAVDEGNKEPVRGSMKTWDMVVRNEGSGGGAHYTSSLVGDVKSRMQANISQVLQRGETLEDLSNQAEALSQSALSFQRSAVRLKKSGGFFSGLFSGWFGSSNLSRHTARSSSPEAMCLPSETMETCHFSLPADSDWPTPPCSSVSQCAPQPQTSLSALVTLQQANGSWCLDDSLAHQLGKGRSELEEACPVQCVGVMAAVWATVLALCAMQTRHQDKQEEWELVAGKAEGWLKRQALPSDLTMDQLHAAARKCI